MAQTQSWLPCGCLLWRYAFALLPLVSIICGCGCTCALCGPLVVRQERPWDAMTGCSLSRDKIRPAALNSSLLAHPTHRFPGYSSTCRVENRSTCFAGAWISRDHVGRTMICQHAQHIPPPSSSEACGYFAWRTEQDATHAHPRLDSHARAPTRPQTRPRKLCRGGGRPLGRR